MNTSDVNNFNCLNKSIKKIIAHILWTPVNEWDINTLLSFYNLPSEIRDFAKMSMILQ